MSIAAIVRALVQAGASPEMILAAVEAAEGSQSDALAKRRQSDADRQRRHRANVMSRDVTVTERDTPSPGMVPSAPSPNPNPTIPLNPPTPAAAGGARDLAALEAALLEAGGRALNRTTAGLWILAEPLRWLNAGCDLDLDILPVIRSLSARAGPSSIRSWAFFTEQIAATHQRRTAPMPTVDTHHQPTRPSNDIAAAFDRLDARIAAHGARDRE